MPSPRRAPHAAVAASAVVLTTRFASVLCDTAAMLSQGPPAATHTAGSPSPPPGASSSLTPLQWSFLTWATRTASSDAEHACAAVVTQQLLPALGMGVQQPQNTSGSLATTHATTTAAAVTLTASRQTCMTCGKADKVCPTGTSDDGRSLLYRGIHFRWQWICMPSKSVVQHVQLGLEPSPSVSFAPCRLQSSWALIGLLVAAALIGALIIGVWAARTLRRRRRQMQQGGVEIEAMPAGSATASDVEQPGEGGGDQRTSKAATAGEGVHDAGSASASAAVVPPVPITVATVSVLTLPSPADVGVRAATAA
jgi:hypothetical protein